MYKMTIYHMTFFDSNSIFETDIVLFITSVSTLRGAKRKATEFCRTLQLISRERWNDSGMEESSFKRIKSGDERKFFLTVSKVRENRK